MIEKRYEMEKKIIIRWVLSILLFTILGIGYALHVNDFSSVKGSKDAVKFKKEYESLNGQKRKGQNYTNMNVTIPSDNPIVYASEKQVLNLLEKGTGILYFGFPDCPWCRNVVPVLVDTAQTEGIDTIYYYNAKEDRDEKRLVGGKVEVVKKGSAFYGKLMDKLGNKASIYDGLQDENIKRLYFPTVLFVKNGEIVLMHEGTVSSQIDPLVRLNQKQETELRKIFIDGMNAIYGEVCDDKC